MPSKPNYIKRTHPAKQPPPHTTQAGATRARAPRLRKSLRYAELRCKSNFSFLRGASHPEELAERAAQLQYEAIAITDRNTLAGVVRMHCAAQTHNIKLIVGAEIHPTDAPPILLYAADRSAYGRLCRIITCGRLRAVKGACAVTLSDIAQHADGLLAAAMLTEHDYAQCDPTAARVSPHLHTYRDIFNDRLYLAAGAHGDADDVRRLAITQKQASILRIPMLATNDVHYHTPKRRFLQDVLTCIRKPCTIHEAGRSLFANAERHLKSPAEMHALFADYPDALARTVELADRCHFRLDELRYEYPEALCPKNRDLHDYLTELTFRGAERRYPNGLPEKIRAVIDHELALIKTLRYEPYFLTVWDIVRFARSRDILCQGRGSAANSAVCFCLGITSVDPGRIDLLFERFVSAERNEPPDIDVDFEHERREEVFQYIYEKYGREHAAIVAEVITYRPRSAIRDVGKALGLSLDRIGALAKKHDWWNKQAIPEAFLREAGFDPSDRTVQMLIKLVGQLLGFPRHLSQHVGGFVITRGPLCEMVPLENGAMPGRTFIQWDKDDIEALGILKIDCLALGMLTAIHKCLKMIGKDALTDIPAEDPSVYAMIRRADTIGVFQIESRAQMSMLPRLRPMHFYDLVIEVAIVRPGPIQGGMVHPYLRRRDGIEPVAYPNEAVKAVLQRTLGVPLFQEQAMRLAIVAAGFTPGEADQLRRAMAGWRRAGAIDAFREKLISGMLANGLSLEFAERCFKQICGFGEYGFPESHAASFALLVYASCWLKRYHPAAFCAAVLNSQPMGFYHPAQLVRDARDHGTIVLPIDVNFSGYDCRLERDANSLAVFGAPRGSGLSEPHASACAASRANAPREPGAPRGLKPAARGESAARGGTNGQKTNRPAGSNSKHAATAETWGRSGPAVRLGMRLIKGVSPTNVEGIERARREKPLRSVADLARRSGVSPALLARLAAADAMQSMGLNRREALWKVLAIGKETPLYRESEPREAPTHLPQLSLSDNVYADYATVGLSLIAHPISLVRKALARIKVSQNRVLASTPNGRRVRVGGLVLVRQRPATASGITFCTIEDETASANLVIRPEVFERYRQAARASVAVIAEGRVERQGSVVHVQVHRIHDLSDRLSPMTSGSRDFR